jgi:hypothetical protein
VEVGIATQNSEMEHLLVGDITKYVSIPLINNQDGRLGNGGTTNIETPTPLNHHKLGIYTLTCGGWHTIGLTHGGQASF